MKTSTAVKALIGRSRECAELDAVLADVREGRGRVLVVRGEPGVGKSALLDYVGRRALGCTVVRVTGVESEMELAYAGLHQLCAPLLDRLSQLPGPQQAALRAAFGLTSGMAPDQLLIGLAVLGLLSDVAHERPLICLVDDMHWIDEASAAALAFVGRRLGMEPVGIVVTSRPSPEDEPDPGEHELVPSNLSDHDARVLLRSVLPGPIDDAVLRRLLAEADGNPLALLELPRGLSPEQLAGGYHLPEVRTLRGRIEQSYARRIATLPQGSRRLLLLAAAESRQDPVLIWRAAAALHIAVADAGPAEAEGLIAFRGEVRFSHPLVRSTVYRAASAAERRLVHRALAHATSARRDPDRRAWHLAHATAGLDDAVATELASSADRAQARGGLAAAAAFWERAAELTADPSLRSRRAIAAARCKFQAGAPERAGRLLDIAEVGAVDEPASARAYLVRAQIAAATGHSMEVPLLDAARRLASVDVDLSDETYRDAFYAALLAGRLAEHDQVHEVAVAVRTDPERASMPPDRRRPTASLLDGLASVVIDGHSTGIPILRRSLTDLRGRVVTTDEFMGWLPLATRLAIDTWDEDTWAALCAHMIEVARGQGHLRMLPVALNLGLVLELFSGQLATATDMADEHRSIADATDLKSPPYGRLALAAWRGSEADTRDIVDSSTAEAMARSEGQWLTARGWALALLYNAHGRYDEALTAARDGAACPHELSLAGWSMVELVEAAARTGVPVQGQAAAAWLTEASLACGTDWALGTAARSRALITTGPEAEADYREAVERLGRTRLRWSLARAQLVYGEWLRREGRRIDARAQLAAAHDMFADMGAVAFAERARRELTATGATARRRSAETAVELTEQEAQIARLAASGLTNPQVAGRLFVSPRTIEWHLRKVYSKLGITSRTEIAGALNLADNITHMDIEVDRI